jgi:hypothetical protein
VFVGYGIQAPEFGWDDYKGADLRGKVLVMLNDEPDSDPALFAGSRRLYYGRWDYKLESAARQQAAGVLLVHTKALRRLRLERGADLLDGGAVRAPRHDRPAPGGGRLDQRAGGGRAGPPGRA